MQKNEIIEVTVAAITHEGSGLARHEGMAVFIPMTAVGDRLRARVVKVLRSYAYARVEKLLEPSPCRVEQRCPVYQRCGGCSLRHMEYAQELLIKSGWVQDNLQRIGGVTLGLEKPLASPRDERYRNKAQYPVRLVDGKICMGFFSGRSHQLVAVEDCLLQPAFFADICKAVKAYMTENGVLPYNEESHTGLVRHLYIRHAEKTGQIMVCLVVNGNAVPQAGQLLERLQAVCPALTTVVLSHNQKRTNVILGERLTVLMGDGFIEDELCGVRVRLSPLSFYQVNREAAEALYTIALDYANPQAGETLLDLYCGAGTIGLSMASRVTTLIGVEVVPQAVEDARRSAQRAGVKHARFLCADAGAAAARLAEEGAHPDIVVLDPPRKGADDATLQAVVEMNPKRIVYISCDSATLARDCKKLGEAGYKPVRGRAVDLFPRTAHVEAVLLLTREDVGV